MEKFSELKSTQANLNIQFSLLKYLYFLKRDVKQERVNNKKAYIYNRLMEIISQKNKKMITINLCNFLLEIKNFSGSNAEKRDLINECCNFFDRSYSEERSAVLMITQKLSKIDYKTLNSSLRKLWVGYSNENPEDLDSKWKELNYFLETGELLKLENVITPDNFEEKIINILGLVVGMYERILSTYKKESNSEKIEDIKEKLRFIAYKIIIVTGKKEILLSEIKFFVGETIKDIENIKTEYKPFFSKEGELSFLKKYLEELCTYKQYKFKDSIIK